MSSKTASLWPACVFLLAACAQTPPPTSSDAAPAGSEAADLSPQHASSAASAAPAEEAKRSAARTLAFSDPGGSALVDNQIRGYQQKLQKVPQHADTWTLLGRAWIQKARDT